MDINKEGLKWCIVGNVVSSVRLILRTKSQDISASVASISIVLFLICFSH